MPTAPQPDESVLGPIPMPGASTLSGLGMAKQLGWVPPTPVYLLKMARARRRAVRAA